MGFEGGQISLSEVLADKASAIWGWTLEVVTLEVMIERYVDRLWHEDGSRGGVSEYSGLMLE